MNISRMLPLAATLCLSQTLWAQAVQASSNESADQTQTVIARLGELNHLDGGKWRFHAGDVAHGENPALDDSNWQLVGENSEAPTASVWYRRWIEVPARLHGYDLSGAKIWFRFAASTDSPLQEIVYINGRRAAMGENLEPIVLFDHAKPGEKALVAVSLPLTAHKKDFENAELKIEFPANRPSPEDLREEILSTMALLPSLSQNLPADQETLAKAAQDLDLKALESGDQSKFDASLRQAQADLKPLQPLLRQSTIYMTGNSHIDAAWKWPWTETVDVVKRTFISALQLMNEYPNYTYAQSSAQYNEWIAEKYPYLNEEIRRRVSQGRWEIVGGMWVEPDLNIPDGESIARSLLIGKRWFWKNYGVDVKVGWNPDSFGYNWQMPQIYKKSGVNYFVTQKMSWNDTNKLPFKLFWWQSPDGSKVLTYFPHSYSNWDLKPERLSSDLAEARNYDPGLTELMDLYGVGDHGGGPTRTVLDEGMHWVAADRAVPKMKFSGAQAFFSNVEKQLSLQSPQWNYQSIARGYQAPATVKGQVSIPTWNSEMYFEYHRGVLTTQANHKRNMRESTELALNAEKYAALAWLYGDAYPAEQLTEDWKKITFNDFHDLAAGSGIGVIYKDSQRDYDQVRWSTGEISAKALHTLAAQINTRAAGSTPVLVFNPLAWKRSGEVTVDVQLPAKSPGIAIVDAQNRVLPSMVLSSNPATNSYQLLVQVNDVPALGYKVLNAVPQTLAFASDLKAEGTTLENSALRVVVDRSTGCITSLYDKKAQHEALAAGACGNELQAFNDTPKEYDAWNIDPGTLDQPPLKMTRPASVELIEHNPMRAVIRVTRKWQSSSFTQDIALYNGSDQVQVTNDIDWHESHVLLKAAFPLSATGPFATYEIPFGSIERPTTRNNSWEQAQFEVPALRWADLGDGHHGVSLINDSKYGYDARGNVLRLSLLRSPTSPDPVADRGRQHFSYALYPHAGDWKQALTVRHGYEFNYKLAAMQVQAHAGALPAEYSFVSASPANVVVTAMKKAEDTDSLVFHLYEWAGKAGNAEITVPAGAKTAIVTNLLEQVTGPDLTVSQNSVTVPVHPYEILAVRVDYTGNKTQPSALKPS